KWPSQGCGVESRLRQLKSVVSPARSGRMSRTSWPSATSNETPSSAKMPPKRTVRSRTDRMGWSDTDICSRLYGARRALSTGAATICPSVRYAFCDDQPVGMMSYLHWPIMFCGFGVLFTAVELMRPARPLNYRAVIKNDLVALGIYGLLFLPVSIWLSRR